MQKQKLIKCGKKFVEINKFNYFYNGHVMMAVDKTSNIIKSTVPKKYWQDIFLEPSITTYSRTTKTIPVTVHQSKTFTIDRLIKLLEPER